MKGGENMHYSLAQLREDYPNVWMMLQRIPTDLWPIFLPDSPDELPFLETNVLMFRSREGEREQVMAIQRLCGFDLEPNASLPEMKALARLQGRKMDDLLRRRESGNGDTAN